MEITRTIPILIEDSIDLLETVKEFNRFQNEISPVCFNGSDPLKALGLHQAVYHTLNSMLPSQLKCSAIRLTAAAYSSARSNKRPATRVFEFRKPSALFLVEKRGRDASFRKGKLSISTINGRKHLAYRIPKAFQADFDNAIIHNAIRVQGDGRATLCLTLEVPDPVGVTPVGIDLGVNNALVASTHDKTLFVSGRKLAVDNTKTRKTRSRLQSKLAGRKAEHKDTASVRRVLKRLSRKTRNRNLTFCKETAARLCEWVPSDAILVLEDLKIKPKSRKDHVRKGTRRKLNNWFYNTMLAAIRNKTERLGLGLALVDPAYTSQTCSRCGLLGTRVGSRFSCSCGYSDHADVNASYNIRLKFTVLRSSGPPVNRP